MGGQKTFSPLRCLLALALLAPQSAFGLQGQQDRPQIHLHTAVIDVFAQPTQCVPAAPDCRAQACCMQHVHLLHAYTHIRRTAFSFSVVTYVAQSGFAAASGLPRSAVGGAALRCPAPSQVLRPRTAAGAPDARAARQVRARAAPARPCGRAAARGRPAVGPLARRAAAAGRAGGPAGGPGRAGRQGGPARARRMGQQLPAG